MATDTSASRILSGFTPFLFLEDEVSHQQLELGAAVQADQRSMLRALQLFEKKKTPPQRQCRKSRIRSVYHSPKISRLGHRKKVEGKLKQVNIPTDPDS